MKLANISNVLKNLKEHFLDYLIEEGFLGSYGNRYDKFLCPNPDHEDKVPSSNILKDGVHGYCHGCKVRFDILLMNSWLKGVSASGPGFVTNNLLPLCERYKIEVDFGDISEEDRFKLDSYRVCQFVSDYIVTQKWSEIQANYVAARGISPDQCMKLGIGVVSDYDDLYVKLKKHWTSVFLKEVGLEKKSMFSPSSIIFPIKDSAGTVAGFISRDIEFESRLGFYNEKGRLGTPPKKYDSSPEKNRIFIKRDILFGLSDITKGSTVYVFEGQFDWALAKSRGLTNCVALCGTAFTHNYINALCKAGVVEVVMVLDADKTGQETLHKLILGDKEKGDVGILADSPLRIKILELPDGYDPAQYINEFGIEQFLELTECSAFAWALAKQDIDLDPVQVCENMMPLILAESNRLIREGMIADLSEISGLSGRAITEEIQRRDDIGKLKVDQQKRDIVDDAYRELKFGQVKDSTSILKMAVERMEELDNLSGVDVLGSGETIEALDEQEKSEFELEGSSGFNFGNLSNIEIALNGEMKSTVIAIGGGPNVGKTSLQSQLVYELVKNNSNLIVIVHTIDDNRKQFNRRLVSHWAYDYARGRGMSIADVLSLNKVSNPKYWLDKDPIGNAGLEEVRSFGYDSLKQAILDGRLHIKDTTHGRTVAFLEKLCKKVTQENPGCKIVAILDNFHRARDFDHLDDTAAVKKRSRYLKQNIAQGLDITVISTFEYKKVPTGQRPTNNDLRDAADLEYDINYLENLFSPLKAAQDTNREENCFLWHGHPYNKMPIVEGDIGKNKITEVKEKHYFKFFPAQSRYECITPDEAQAIENYNRSSVAREKGQDGIWIEGKYYKADDMLLKASEEDTGKQLKMVNFI